MSSLCFVGDHDYDRARHMYAAGPFASVCCWVCRVGTTNPVYVRLPRQARSVVLCQRHGREVRLPAHLGSRFSV